MHPPGRKGVGLGKIWFQGLDLKAEGWALLSEGQGGAKFSEGARFSRASYHVFLQTYYICSNIVINYSYHYVYSIILDKAEFLTQNDDDPI